MTKTKELEIKLKARDKEIDRLKKKINAIFDSAISIQMHHVITEIERKQFIDNDLLEKHIKNKIRDSISDKLKDSAMFEEKKNRNKTFSYFMNLCLIDRNKLAKLQEDK